MQKSSQTMKKLSFRLYYFFQNHRQLEIIWLSHSHKPGQTCYIRLLSTLSTQVQNIFKDTYSTTSLGYQFQYMFTFLLNNFSLAPVRHFPHHTLYLVPRLFIVHLRENFGSIFSIDIHQVAEDYSQGPLSVFLRLNKSIYLNLALNVKCSSFHRVSVALH